MFDKTSHVMTATHKARCLLEDPTDSWKRHKVEAKHAYYVNFLFQHQSTSWLQQCTNSEDRQSLWKSSPSCKLTKACSSKPTANLLIITYLQRPWGRRSCKNTFDIVYTKMFFSPLVAMKYPLGYRSESLCSVSAAYTLDEITHPPVLRSVLAWQVDGLVWWADTTLYLADGYSIKKALFCYPRVLKSPGAIQHWLHFEPNQTIKQGQSPPEKKTEAIDQRKMLNYVNKYSF